MPSTATPAGGDEAVRVDVLAAEGQDRPGAPTPECRAAGGAPKAAWARSPQGRAGLSVDLDQLGDQGDGVGAQPGDRQPGERVQAEQDRLAEPQLVDAADVRRAQAPSPGWPSCRRRRPTRVDADGRLDVGREPGELVHLGLVGDDAALAGEVGARCRPERRPGGRGRPAPAATRSAGSIPSRRSPSSTMSTTACVVPRRDDARERASSTDGLGVQAGRRVTYDGVDLAEHGGADQRARRRPGRRRRDGRGSRRASRRARRRRRAASPRPPPGDAERGLGDAGDPDARGRRAGRRATRVLCSIASRSNSSARRGHRGARDARASRERGEGVEDHVDQLVERAGSAGRWPGGRARARCSSMAALTLVVGHVLVVDRDADDLGVGEGLDQGDLAGDGRHRHHREVAERPGARARAAR